MESNAPRLDTKLSTGCCNLRGPHFKLTHAVGLMCRFVKVIIGEPNDE